MKAVVFILFCCFPFLLRAQTYPNPEYGNEVYALKKDSVYTLTRLEKNSAAMETKTKMGGLGGGETAYNFDGGSSPVRLHGADHLYFIFSTGNSPVSNSSSDSVMRANGADPSMLSGMFSGMTDPSNTISLYKVENDKSARKILLQKSPGALPFGSHKIKSSDKYTFSVKKVREGYWELQVDKTLPKGEYAFSMMNLMGGGAMGSVLIFAFGID